MMPTRINKRAEPDKASPNLIDYDRACKEFSWADARARLKGLPGDRGLNIGHEAVDRHALGARRDHTAIRWLGKRGDRRELSYLELSQLSSQFAHALTRLGVSEGDRVFSLIGRLPELYAAVIGTLKHKSVFCPLFSAFGPEPIKQRMSLGSAKVLVTTASLYKKKVAPIRSELSTLEHVVIVGDSEAVASEPGVRSFDELIGAEPTEFDISPTPPDTPALLHFTSGTTGTPKGALHVHEAIVVHRMTGEWVLDLHPEDIYWCTADPGWVTGTSYGIIAPLALGVTMVVDEAEFDAVRWYEILEREKVQVWYTAPTAIRMLMRLGEAPIEGRNLSHLRFCASVGEPLNPEGVLWGERVLGRPFHDNWWQTETGGIMIANYASMDVVPGSMGKPLPGIEAAIVERDSKGELRVVEEPNREGELALRAGWPSMFREYVDQPERYAKCFDGGWYLSGDLAKRTEDGYFVFVGREDDVIKSAGHLVGPFEVESALVEHPAVAEAGVIGKPDPVAGSIIKAFVALKPAFAASEELERELMGFARKRLGPAVAPREIAFRASLPKTRSGKIMRRLLKAEELGLPTGDTSTLEVDPAARPEE